tara:strand:+ start:462 stop:1553 length:1092 start_codon:yes stop_codon:yes gene_type:complete
MDLLEVEIMATPVWSDFPINGTYVEIGSADCWNLFVNKINPMIALYNWAKVDTSYPTLAALPLRAVGDCMTDHDFFEGMHEHLSCLTWFAVDWTLIVNDQGFTGSGSEVMFNASGFANLATAVNALIPAADAMTASGNRTVRIGASSFEGIPFSVTFDTSFPYNVQWHNSKLCRDVVNQIWAVIESLGTYSVFCPDSLQSRESQSTYEWYKPSGTSGTCAIAKTAFDVWDNSGSSGSGGYAGAHLEYVADHRWAGSRKRSKQKVTGTPTGSVDIKAIGVGVAINPALITLGAETFTDIDSEGHANAEISVIQSATTAAADWTSNFYATATGETSKGGTIASCAGAAGIWGYDLTPYLVVRITP